MLMVCTRRRNLYIFLERFDHTIRGGGTNRKASGNKQRKNLFLVGRNTRPAGDSLTVAEADFRRRRTKNMKSPSLFNRSLI